MRAIADEKRRRAREALVQDHLPLARRLTWEYRHRRDYEDVEQVARCALVAAAARFDPTRGFSFVTFATPTIRGEIKHYLRDCTWAVHVTRPAKELALEVGRAADALAAELGRSPTVAELSEQVGRAPEDVLEALDAGRCYQPESLFAVAGEDSSPLIERLAQDDSSYPRVENRDAIRAGAETLAPRERELLRLRFFEELSQREIGERLGISQMHVSRLLRRALEDMHAAVAA